MSHVQLREASTDSLAHMCTEIVLLPHAATGGTDVWGGMGKLREIMCLIVQQQAEKNVRIPKTPTGAEIWCHVFLNICRKIVWTLGCREVSLPDFGSD